MALVRLGREWSHLMEKYSADHQHPVNQACHAVGIPLIAGSIPLAATVVGLPLAVPMFSVGWTFQMVGHLFEGKKPAFVEDRRHLVVGLLWWARKRGLAIETTEAERV
jgi:uncharacterized membrane protein YGL010W